MVTEVKTKIPEVLEKQEAGILTDWMKEQVTATTVRPDLLKEGDLREQSGRFLELLRVAARGDDLMHIQGPNWALLREMLDELSRSRAVQGFTSSETATFVLSFKQPLFRRLRQSHDDLDGLAEDLWRATALLDKLGLYTTEAFIKSREDIIGRQAKEMFELSTPVVELWQGILGLPIIGTLDSKRTQLVMETLLERVAQTQAQFAIIDITGVPTVDTQTAQNLLKTVNATRLMGAECIISGVRPQIAQTMVHLGVNLAGVITKSTLAGALAVAFKQRALAVKPISSLSGNG